MYYAIALLFLFPVNVYNALNLLLASGFVIQEGLMLSNEDSEPMAESG